MPSDVKEKTNTTAALETIAGRRLGRVTSRKARHRVAPRVRATFSKSGSCCAQLAPTMRATTAMFT